MSSRVLMHSYALRYIVSLILFGSVGTLACSSNKPERKNLIAAPTEGELELLTEAMMEYDKGLFSVANKRWTDLKEGYPGSYFATLAELKAGDSYFYLSDFTTALSYYEEFARVHPGHEAMPYVRYQIGNCYLGEYDGERHDQSPLHLAMKAFQAVIHQYPGSEFEVLSRRRIQECRELLAKHESYVAGFYLAQGQVEASLGRYSQLAQDFPESTEVKSLEETLRAEHADELQQYRAETVTKAGASTKASNKPGTPPEMPTFAFRSGTNGMLRQVVGSQSQSLQKKRSSPIRESELSSKMAAEQSPLWGISCEETANGNVLVAYTREPLELIQRSNAKDSFQGVFVSRARRDQSPTKVTDAKWQAGAKDSDREISCRDQNVTVRLRSGFGFSERQPKFPLLQVTLDKPVSGTVQVLTVDRPDRLVFFITKPQNS